MLTKLHTISMRYIGLVLCGLLLLSLPAYAAQTVYRGETLPPATQAPVISLNDVLHRVLSQSPEVAQAIASLSENKAAVDLAKSAYLPTINAVGEYNWQKTSNYNNGFGGFEGNGKDLGPTIKTMTGSLNLDWLLFDFGQRGASLDAARHRLNAVLATQKSTRINTLIEALRLYTQAYNAYGQLQTLVESEEIASKSLEIVQALFDAKVAGLTEKLQAQTAKAQASLNRSIAQGNWNIAKGQLAVAMGLPLNSHYILAEESAVFKTVITHDFIDSVVDEVKNNHPRMRSLRAEIAALQSTLSATKSANWGQVNLVANGSKGESKNFDGLGNDLETKSATIGLRATIPLLNWKQQSAREAQVLAQIDNARSRLMATRNTLLTDLWRNVQQVKTTSVNLINTQFLLTTAGQNYEVTLGRYRQGVGSIVDLLRAQSTLANAKQQLQNQKISHIQSHMRLTLSAGSLTGEKFNFSN